MSETGYGSNLVLMSTRLRSADGVVIEEVRDELCLLRLDTSDVLVLNRTASDVWLLITDGVAEDDVAAALAKSYDVALDDVAGQVADVIRQCRSRGFLVDAG